MYPLLAIAAGVAGLLWWSSSRAPSEGSASAPLFAGVPATQPDLSSVDILYQRDTNIWRTQTNQLRQLGYSIRVTPDGYTSAADHDAAILAFATANGIPYGGDQVERQLRILRAIDAAFRALPVERRVRFPVA